MNPESEFTPDLPNPEPQDKVFHYDHFYQMDPKWQEPKYGQVPPPETMCWLACLTMGIQALSENFSQEEAYEKAVQIYSGKTFEQRIAALAASGEDVEIYRRYMQEVEDGLASRDGLGSALPETHPQEFKRIIDHIFSSEDLNLEIDIVRRKDLEPERAVGKLGTLLSEGKMIFLRLLPQGQGQPAHLIFVAGHKEGRFLISDSALQTPFWLNQDRLPEIFMAEQTEAERKSDPNVGLYVLGKKA